MAVMTLAACALKPPMLPAMDDPMRFLEMLRSTRAEVEVFSTELTMCAGTMAWKVLVNGNKEMVAISPLQQLTFLCPPPS